MSKEEFKLQLKELKAATGKPIMEEAAKACGVTRMGLYLYLREPDRVSRKGIPTNLRRFIRQRQKEVKLSM